MKLFGVLDEKKKGEGGMDTYFLGIFQLLEMNEKKKELKKKNLVQ